MADFLEALEDGLARYSGDEMAVARQAFGELLGGRPASIAGIARGLGAPRLRVEAIVARLVERGTVTLDREGDTIVGARGLSLTPTAHRLTVLPRPPEAGGARQLYAFCAVDAVGIPAALALDAHVESQCHLCGAELALTLTGGAVARAPADLVIWAAEHDPARPLRDYT